MHSEILDDVRALMRLRQRLSLPLDPPAALPRRLRAGDAAPVPRLPDDPEAWAETDEFLLGDAVLVAPVTEPSVTTRRVRLSAGADWRDAWTGEVFPSAATLDRPATYARPPFFIRLDPPSGIAPG